MILTNNDIYNYANNLIMAFNDNEQKLPIKINFCLQKNKKTLLALAQDIDAARIEVGRTHGTYNQETGQYYISPEKVAIANQELDDLFNIEQDVDILTVKYDSLNDDVMLTTAQMEAIMFMID